jgi:hypothetical protein
MTFATYVGIDYSGAETPTSRLRGLQVYRAGEGLPERVSTPSQPEERHWNWCRSEIADWLIGLARDGTCFIAGIDHAFSFPISYLRRYLDPPLTSEQRRAAELQGWILGVT